MKNQNGERNGREQKMKEKRVETSGTFFLDQASPFPPRIGNKNQDDESYKGSFVNKRRTL